jgi:hypothetical protein
MLPNLSNVAIPQQVADDVTTKLNEIKTALAPYMITLADGERGDMLRLSDKSEAFLSKVVNYTESNPEFIPAYLDKADLMIDVNNCKLLDPLTKLAQQLCDSLNDTRIVAGNEAFLESLAYYNNIKLAGKSGIGNAGTIYEDLSQRFPGRKGAKSAIPKVK